MDKKNDNVIRIHFEHPLAAELIALALASVRVSSKLVILCIGTDRSTGDALGPLVGSRVSKHQFPQTHVYGTLSKPVHAVNLKETVDKIEQLHPNADVLAIDACLGRTESIGYISLRQGPLSPGSGVNKDLPKVGTYHLTGVVNVAGLMEYLVLQNTRLSLVMNMAEVISDSLELCLGRWHSLDRGAESV